MLVSLDTIKMTQRAAPNAQHKLRQADHFLKIEQWCEGNGV